jgi:hypothetical protein
LFTGHRMWDNSCMVLDRLIRWTLDERGVWKTIVAPVPILGLLTALGLISRESAPTILAIVLIFEALVIVAWLNRKLKQCKQISVANQAQFEEELESKNKILERYVERILAGPHREHKVKNWKHIYTYSLHGDAVIEEWETIVNGPEPLSFTQHTVIASRQLDSNGKSAVTVVANHVNTDGRTLGAAIDQITTKWSNNQELQATLHFLDQIAPHQTFQYYMKWTWPRLSEHLLTGGVEEFYWTVAPNTTEGIAVEIIFDKSCNVKRDLKISAYQDCPEPVQDPYGGGRKLEWNYPNPLPNVKVGFTLDTKDAF